MDDHFYDVISGTPCPFWDASKPPYTYDNEQQLAVFDAVQKACAMPGQSDAQRWQMVMRHLNRLADDYAQHMASAQAEYRKTVMPEQAFR
jgi:hypothetical protein